MIENEKQAELTRFWIDRFKTDMEALPEPNPYQKPVNNWMIHAQRNSIQSQLEDLQKELDEWLAKEKPPA